MSNNRSTNTPGNEVSSPGSEASRVRRMTENASGRVSRGVDSATSRVGSGISSAAHGIERAAGGVAERLEGAGRYLQESDTRTLGSDITNAIRNHPKAAIGIGLGVGFLIGRMLAR